MGEFDQAEEVGFKGFAISLDGNVLDGVFGGVEVNSGVVDEDIQVGEFSGKSFGGGLDGV